MPWNVIGLGLGVALLGLGYRGFRCRVKGRGFSLQLGDQQDVLTTELGRFRLSRHEGRLYVERPGAASAWVALGDVLGAQSRVASRQALAEELLFEGVGIMDLFQEYRDRRMYWTLVFLTRNGLVPVAQLSQYQVNDWFNFITPVQLWLLRKVGLYRDGSEVADELLDALHGMLRRAGLNVRGGYDYALPTGAMEGAFLPREARKPGPIDIPQDEGPGPAWPDAGGRDRW